MTDKEKSLLRSLAKRRFSFSEIRRYVDCSNETILKYIKIFKYCNKLDKV